MLGFRIDSYRSDSAGLKEPVGLNQVEQQAEVLNLVQRRSAED
ncbi:hypothetical protein SynPROSU1_01187 [Synechococcus sp. PROS-U-1]|nr:hypothetical protein SynPROSU1_01187 [Synechococcus sp. PROS-U-1]